MPSSVENSMDFTFQPTYLTDVLQLMSKYPNACLKVIGTAVSTSADLAVAYIKAVFVK